ncbi:MAG: hypothetical protein KBC48_02675 [Candidatus Pacebacteria bacterium]|nr:hypothetical protein [Candidatus Paceibacterota bacterium]
MNPFDGTLEVFPEVLNNFNGVTGGAPGGVSGGAPGPSGQIVNPIKYNDLMSFINALIEIVIQIGTPILVLAVIYVGFLFVQASGKPEKLNEAKSALVYTLIGAAIVLGAFIISAAIKGTVDQLSI